MHTRYHTITATSNFLNLQFHYFQILLDIKAYFKSQPSLMDVPFGDEDKFTVCGDIHGQFYDLMNIFKLNGLPSPTNPYVNLLSILN